MKGLSAAGESSQKDLEVWAMKLPFPSFPRCREEQTGEKRGWDVDIERGVEEKALDEASLVLPRLAACSRGSPGEMEVDKQAEIPPGG